MLKHSLHIMLAVLMGAVFGLVSTTNASALDATVYNQPGVHLENGRYWKTSCDKYSSSVVRCRTDIFATKKVAANGTYYNHNGWVFNNLTYLPSNRAAWAKNPLGKAGTWKAADGREWKTDCDTATTGGNGCRSYAMATVVVKSGAKYVAQNQWVMNNMVRFSTASTPAQTTILPAAPAIPNVPVEKPSSSANGINLARASMWDRIAKCESGNNWAINTGNGYYGGLQFNLPTWRSVNGQDFAAYPHKASREQQITVANRLYAKRGTQPWSCA